MATRTGKLAKLTGFMLYEDTAFGRMNGIFLNANINNLSGITTVTAYAKRAAGVDMQGINAFLKDNKKLQNNASAAFDGTAVTVTILNYLKLNVQIVADLLSDFSQYLAGQGYYSTCAFCDKSDELGYTVQEGRVMEACPACHKKLEGILTDLKKEREQTGSYFSGAAGAVLGGIIGIIPWVLIGLIGYIASISGMIMAFLTYKFYQLFKGKRGRAMVLIVILVLIVFTYTGVVISDSVSIITEINKEGIHIDNVKFITDMAAAPFSPGIEIVYTAPVATTAYITGQDWADMTGDLWRDIALGFLFAGIGSFVFLRRIGRESAGKDIEVKRLN